MNHPGSLYSPPSRADRKSTLRLRFFVGAVLSTGAGLIGLAPDPVEAAPIELTVTSTANGPDAAPGNGDCATSAGNCTLRAAIGEANAHEDGPITINFDIPGAGPKVINVPSVLTLNNADGQSITIDGFSQPGSNPNTSSTVDNAVRNIELTGRGPNGTAGLQIWSPGNVVRGLVLNEFSIAIRIDGNGGPRSANNNRVVGNLIGLDADGSPAPGYDASAPITGNPCVAMVGGAANNRIGTPTAADRNTISGCYERGIYIDNARTFQNTIHNNIIGMDPTGTEARPNWIGIDINGGASNHDVGGLGTNEGNLLSGNNISGVEISHDPETQNNDILGNLIGTDPSGNSATAETRNGGDGIRLEGKRSDGDLSGTCNPNAGVSVVTGNVIVNSGRGGILIDKGFNSSTIRDNLIGVTRNGTVIGNTLYGVRILAGSHKIIVRENRIAGGDSGIQVSPKSIDPPQPANTFGCPTDFNTFTENIISDVANNAIDLADSALVGGDLYGTPTADGASSYLANEGMVRPTISSEGGVVEINAQQLAADLMSYEACGGCVVELFATTRTAGEFGLGEGFIGSATASASGVVTFTAPPGGWPARVTATATNPSGSTSEFSVSIVPTSSTPPDPTPPNPTSPGGHAAGRRNTGHSVVGFDDLRAG